MVDYCHTAIDLQIFRQYIAPALGITHRYVGTEPPQCVVTSNYNQQMYQWLGSPPLLDYPNIEVVEVPRLMVRDQPISASQVRSLLVRGELEPLNTLLPSTSIAHLSQSAVRPIVHSDDYATA